MALDMEIAAAVLKALASDTAQKDIDSAAHGPPAACARRIKKKSNVLPSDVLAEAMNASSMEVVKAEDKAEDKAKAEEAKPEEAKPEEAEPEEAKPEEAKPEEAKPEDKTKAVPSARSGFKNRPRFQGTASKEAMMLSHIPCDAPEFKVLARGGGNFSATSVSQTWILEVRLNAQNVAMYNPNPRYTLLLEKTRVMIQDCGMNVSAEGVVHPFLKFETATFFTEIRNLFAHRLMANTKNPVHAFAQFLCSVGVKSETALDNSISKTTWTFDPQRWNRTGYRIISGGDKKGGKPFIVFKPPAESA